MSLKKPYLLIRNSIIIFASIVFTTCIYEPFGVYENPVDLDPDPPQINNIEINVNADTLWVYGDHKVRYHFKSSNEKQPILGLNICINGICESVWSDNGEFNILQSALSEGVHKMSILLFTKSGTGSIADHLEREVITLSKDWVVIADYSKINVYHTIEDGYLKLHWDKYKNPDIRSYIVNNSKKTENAFYIDSLYFGDRRTYNISIEKLNGKIVNWGSLRTDENIPIPELKVSDDNSYYFIWHKSPFYNTAKYRYHLSIYEGDISYVKGEKSINDTVFHSKLYFSDRFSLNLYTMSKYSQEHHNAPHSYMSGYAGEPSYLKSYTSFTSADTLSAFDSKTVIKYLANGQTIYNEPIIQDNSFGLNDLKFSPRGRYLSGRYFDLNLSDFIFFVKNLSTGKIYYKDSDDSYASSGDDKFNMNISDNGIVIFRSSSKEFLFDFNNNSEIASRDISALEIYQKPVYPQNRYFVKISPDGKHYIASTLTYYHHDVISLDVFKINSSNLEKMYSLDSESSYWGFNSTDPNMIITVNSNTISVIQCEPYIVLRKIELSTDEVFMNIDYFNNEILTINSNRFIIRDLLSGNVIKKIPRRLDQYYKNDKFTLHNHYIFKDNVMLKTN